MFRGEVPSPAPDRHGGSGHATQEWAEAAIKPFRDVLNDPAAWAKKWYLRESPLMRRRLANGLVEEISPPDRLWACVDSLLLRMRNNSLSSIRQTKKLIASCLQDPNLMEMRDRALPLVESTKTEDFRKAMEKTGPTITTETETGIRVLFSSLGSLLSRRRLLHED
jgi:hypothetical protein